MARVLIVGDGLANRQTLAELLSGARHDVQGAADLLEAVTRLRVAAVDVVVADVRVGAEGDGLNLVRTIKGECPHLPVIVYAAHARARDVVLAIKLGADDYLEFPGDPEGLLLAITNAVESKRYPSAALDPLGLVPNRPYGIVAESPAMRAVLEWVARIGPKDLTVLLVGETGTGKELVARALHAASDRRPRPFVPVNCGALPESLFEAELFGHRKGAFTGAAGDRLGLFEAAHCGTLFLDEVGELPIAVQVRLLRVLEDGEVRRLGETTIRHVDVRVIAATNRDVREEVARGRFRVDLFYRLNGASCRIPPLRDRIEDLEALIDFWLPSIAQRLAPGVRGMSPSALSLLRAHSWSGNVRELKHVLEHAAILASGHLITEQDVMFAIGYATSVAIVGPAKIGQQPQRDLLHAALKEIGAAALADAERNAIRLALEAARGNKSEAARRLRTDYRTLHRKMKQYGIRAGKSQALESS